MPFSQRRRHVPAAVVLEKQCGGGPDVPDSGWEVLDERDSDELDGCRQLPVSFPLPKVIRAGGERAARSREGRRNASPTDDTRGRQARVAAAGRRFRIRRTGDAAAERHGLWLCSVELFGRLRLVQ